MAVLKPLRLRRELSKVTTADPAFAFYSDPTQAIYDDNIQSIVIHRGKSSRGGGHAASTFEMKVNGIMSPTVAGQNCRFFLRDLAAQDIAAVVGQPWETIQFRFQGRMGTVEVEDTGKRQDSTLGAASWLARMYRSSRTTTPAAGTTVDAIFSDVLDLPNAPRGITVAFQGAFDPVFGAQDAVNFADAINRYGADIGYGFYEQRNGSTNVATLPYRKDRAHALAQTQLPLTVSQAISPATWEQANEYTAIRLMYDVTNAEGLKVTRTAEIDNGDPLKETVTEDWSYIQSSTNGVGGQLYQEAYGRVFESNTRMFSVPSVTVDILHLMNSPYEYHRLQAGQLLAMQVGDPVFFSGDWYTALRGVHFAEGMVETITPTSWTIELQLVPYSWAVGDAFPPDVKPRAWRSATETWGEQTIKWGES